MAPLASQPSHQVIRYALSDSPLDWMLVAVTTAGLRFLGFADQPQTLVQALREQFPFDECVEDGASLADWIRRVRSHFSANPTPDVPLDLQGSPFQKRVWRRLLSIPRGVRISYHQLACGIGQPTAVRAVARACAANPVALVVPCHRVIGSDGRLHGYRWGMERKRKLLELERSALAVPA